MSITLIIGPMFCGKTTELLRLIDRKRIGNKNCVIIKHKIDDRFTSANSIVTHSEFNYDKCPIIYHEHLLNRKFIKYIISNFDVVGIDEGFFFKGIYSFCNKLANKGIEVIVSSLESSYKQKLFKEIGKLIATSEKVIKLTAICMHCNNADAPFNIRMIHSNKKILVGGSNIYQSVCRKCLGKFKKANKLLVD